jgi:hypothetical protein
MGNHRILLSDALGGCGNLCLLPRRWGIPYNGIATHEVSEKTKKSKGFFTDETVGK